jgi:hypothetical protein
MVPLLLLSCLHQSLTINSSPRANSYWRLWRPLAWLLHLVDGGAFINVFGMKDIRSSTLLSFYSFLLGFSGTTLKDIDIQKEQFGRRETPATGWTSP